MSKSALKVSPSASTDAVAQALQLVLNDTYALYLLTHNYHWNVEGPKFVSLHSLFEQQYNGLFAAIDTIAERIRALDTYVLTDYYSTILENIQNVSNPLHKEKSKDAVADRMIANLIERHESVIKTVQTAKHAAQKAEDDETEDLMIERIQIHQKALWMLKCIIK